jgi:hypothetical protein
MMANDNHLVRSSPISSGDHPARSVVVCPVHAQLSRRVEPARRVGDTATWGARCAGLIAHAEHRQVGGWVGYGRNEQALYRIAQTSEAALNGVLGLGTAGPQCESAWVPTPIGMVTI